MALPTTIVPGVTTGHTAHHEALHVFYNDFATSLEGRLSALEALSNPRFTVVSFSMFGTLDAFTGQGRYPAPFNGTTSLVITRLGVAATGASVVVDILNDGSSIFTAGPYPKPTITTGNIEGSAGPDPAKADSVAYKDFTWTMTYVGTPSVKAQTLTAFVLFEES